MPRWPYTQAMYKAQRNRLRRECIHKYLASERIFDYLLVVVFLVLTSLTLFIGGY
jgi:hypothetical protein